MTAPVPESWQRFIEALARASTQLAGAADRQEQERAALKLKLARLTEGVGRPPPAPRVPEGTPASIVKAVRETTELLRSAQHRVHEEVARVAEDFEHAAENEDRFVVLVFGEVNAGKTALANHVAGLDYPGGASPRAACFVGTEQAVRLEEKPIECTREYQGFRLPGLLWIDCPGVLSATAANAEKARRLVARADFVVFASNSDGPFKQSELEELKGLIQSTGNSRLDGFLVITRADRPDDDVDEDGNVVRRVVMKPKEDLARQMAWALEQLRTHGIPERVRLERTHALSVYAARDALGLAWKTAAPARLAGPPTAYERSGVPAFLDGLTETVLREGATIKRLWPVKRSRALREAVRSALEPSRKRLTTLARQVAHEREALSSRRKDAADEAADRAAARVGPCLGGNGIFRTKEFKKSVAARDLREHLAREVQRAVRAAVGGELAGARQRISAAVQAFATETDFELDVRERTRTRKYRSTEKGRGVGGAVGGAGGGAAGMWAGAEIGALAGPAGAIIGGLLGGIIGGVLGSLGGGAIGEEFEEEVVVHIPAGTNGEEVIAETQKEMRKAARKAVEKTFAAIDAALFEPVAESIRALQGRVDAWRSIIVLRTPGSRPATDEESSRRRQRGPAAERRRRTRG